MKGVFHNSIDDVVEGYGVKEVLRRPLHASRLVIGEMWKDLNYEKLLPGSKFVKSALNDISILVSGLLMVGPHELIHAGTNLLLGGTNEQIVISALSGGWVYEKLIPGVESILRSPWDSLTSDNYVRTAENPLLAGMIVSAAPFAVMTPLGIYLLAESTF